MLRLTFSGKTLKCALKNAGRCISSFKYSDLSVTETKTRREKPVGNMGFGQYLTDHMLTIEWNLKSGWGKPEIKELAPIPLSPAIKALHYATSAFEGFKVIKGVDKRSRLFRPEKHMERMRRSADRLCLPDFDPVELLECIKKLIRLDESWVPSGPGEALYVRPFIFGCDATLGVDISTKAVLCTILSPVGAYFGPNKKGVSLYADPRFVRAWEGGGGAFKLSSNYAPTLYSQKFVKEKGCQTSLWLYGPEEALTEAGTMNIFVFWINEKGEKELLTPPLSGLILPGVTRESILEITKAWNEFRVVENNITMRQVLKAVEEKRLLHIFGTGTACVISPVAELCYKNERYAIPDSDDPDSVPQRILKEYRDIQLAVNGPHPWTHPIDQPGR
ncbi:hypothetical protein EG68_00338 [Paragonimus skrjabini miyazakii]|uniref:Branched-chain-amino-acid aminotransferase n=1 Tax=Paragonimus skrjabini miyazakii TaxID=59628 RepID=A0A8S9Z928_9TREM|nr:hypothetical protein EG68_00338 [Paragonimus skrjabini miyazakii]